MHTYYGMSLTGNPDQGAVFDEYLNASRKLARGQAKLADLTAESALNFNRLLPTQAPLKILQTSLERLKANPFDLDAIHKLAKAAQAAPWHSLAIAAYADVLKNSAALKVAGNKVRREIKMALGREYYALKDYANALGALQEFQDDPATPKEIVQTIKDAAAAHASESLLRHDNAFNLATPQSAALATSTQAERNQEELIALELVLADTNVDASKLAAAALRLAELWVRAGDFGRAMAVLADAESRSGNLDLAKKSVELELRKRNELIAKQRDQAIARKMETERDGYAQSAYAELLKRLPADGDVRLRCGELLYARGKHATDAAPLKEAIGLLQFEFKTDDQYHRSRLLIAECFLALDLPGAAEVVLTDFLAQLDASRKKGSWCIDAQYLLGVVRERRGDIKGATAAYVVVISTDIKYKDAFARLSALEQAALLPR